MKIPTTWGPATWVTVGVLALGAVVGGIVAITDPHAMPIQSYMKDLGTLASGGGILAIGRGIFHTKAGQTVLSQGATLANTVVHDLGPAGPALLGAAEALPGEQGDIARTVVKDAGEAVTAVQAMENPPPEPAAPAPAGS